MSLDTGIVGYWKLSGDCRDSSGNGNHGENHGADLTAPGRDGRPHGAARFDGRRSCIVVPAHESRRICTGDFSLATWVCTDERLTDTLGDVACKYDPATRKGFTLGLLTYSGATSHQPNYRNVHFGIDGGTDSLRWIDYGRPGNALFAKALAVFEADLYAGTFEAGEHEAGHVYRYAGGQEWIDCGAPDRCNMVAGLAVYDGALYAGVSCYRAQGSSLPESPNRHPGGRIYRYAGGTEWVDCGKLDEGDVIARAGAGGGSTGRLTCATAVPGRWRCTKASSSAAPSRRATSTRWRPART